MKKVISIMLVLVFMVVVQTVKGDFTFSEPTNLGPMINSTVEDGGPCITPDGLSLYFYSFLNGFGIPTVRMASRATIEEPWNEAVNLEPPAIPIGTSLCFTADGLSLFFESFQVGGSGLADIWSTTRATVDDPWSTAINLGPNVNSPALDMGATISSDGLSLFFQSTRTGGFGAEDIYISTRATTSDEWGPAVNLGATVNTSSVEAHPFILPDGLTLLFCSDRTGGYGDWDIWITRRKTKDDDWNTPTNLGTSINTAFGEAEPVISPDGKELYFSDWWIPKPGSIGKNDLWKVSIKPIVDLNSDGIVNAADMCIIVDNWGTDTSLCDIGPTPFGDGVVDVQDLIVLAEHLFEEFPSAEPIE